ncbi:hypothetical protein SR914_19855 [Comamonas testosteroni]|uniref:Uncharacterized protein n=1 Tax=Comamonas testosteroni (strain DSM 14576 / KF-1) TaxID=399795 RepID=B7WRR0_COMTK|nr:hypothetical protein [Comamonas testosteroni]EED67245.1 hypothetical protein CtesDRAFT_PD2191 [Comamonas testosteroni KF-1]WQG65422.1 hypothetical protein SR914_19855 [Comamonas testosteroni]
MTAVRGENCSNAFASISGDAPRLLQRKAIQRWPFSDESASVIDSGAPVAVCCDQGESGLAQAFDAA